jgi:HD-like signal output (HDOD) protein
MSTRAATLERLFAAMQQSRGFPALEETVTAVIHSMGDERYATQQVVEHITGDFALTQKVLKLANSDMYAPFTAGSGSVSAALNMLGSEALLHIVLGTAMVSGAEMENDETLSKTLLSSELARTACKGRSEEVSIAALMYDLGRLMLQKHLPAEATVIEQKLALGLPEDAVSNEILGLTLQELGAEVALKWKLPNSIVSVIDGTGDPDLVAIARFSSAASTLIHAGNPEGVDSLIAALNVQGVDRAGVAGLIRDKAKTIRPRDVVVSKVPNEAVLDDLFSALAAEKMQTVEALAAAMFPTFANTLQTAHCLLFMLTKSGDFAVRYGYGKGIDELRSKLRIGKEYQPTAFHAAIKNNVDVSIADVSRLKVSALPDGYRSLLPLVNKFLILPISNSTVSGLLYCDWDSEKVLSPLELGAVKKLRGLFLPFFAP